MKINIGELYNSWVNGNRKDVVEALIANGKLSDAVRFAQQFPEDTDDRATLVVMLQNRGK